MKRWLKIRRLRKWVIQEAAMFEREAALDSDATTDQLFRAVRALRRADPKVDDLPW